jgi:RNA polymerase sigma-70 factor (ECF subfamily)
MPEERQGPSTSVGLNRLEPGLASRLAAARAGDQLEFGRLTEPHRRELQVHCYRLLGSLHEAEDLVQETMLRAWRRLDTFEGRASFRAWLYKIATNACLDALDQRRRRSLPMSTHPAADPHQPLDPPLNDSAWLEPLPDDFIATAAENPEARYTLHESVTLAFLVALQTLPPRQRAVLIMCDVLDWRASETADCLGLTVSAVNSALYRARVTLAKHYHEQGHELASPLAETRWRDVLDRYVRAWETADVEALVGLLKEDAIFAMPPTPSWYRGRDSIRSILLAIPFAGDARGRWRLLPTQANGSPALGFYQRDQATGRVYRGVGVQVLKLETDGIAEVTTFMNPALLSHFGLPTELA